MNDDYLTQLRKAAEHAGTIPNGTPEMFYSALAEGHNLSEKLAGPHIPHGTGVWPTWGTFLALLDRLGAAERVVEQAERVRQEFFHPSKEGKVINLDLDETTMLFSLLAAYDSLVETQK